MTEVRPTLDAIGAVVERDLRVYASYRVRVFAQLASLLLSMAIFHFVAKLIAVDRFSSPDEYFAFVVSGLLIMFVLQSSAVTAPLVRQELIAGTFERSLVSPMGAIVGSVGMLVFPVVFASGLAIIGFLLAALIFGLPVEWSTAPLALPLLMLASVAFSAIGVFVLALVIAFKQAFGITWALTLISLTGGLYFPVDLLPGWLRWVSDVQPFTPAIEVARHLLLDAQSDADPWVSAARLGAFALVLTPLSLLTLRVAIRHGRRRGTILEY